jgi:hypothetical protein
VPLVPTLIENNHFPQRGQYIFFIIKHTLLITVKGESTDITASVARRGKEANEKRTFMMSYYHKLLLFNMLNITIITHIKRVW